MVQSGYCNIFSLINPSFCMKKATHFERAANLKGFLNWWVT